MEDLLAVVVDDQASNVAIIEEYSRSAGLQTMGFTNPVSALEYCKNNLVDIILVDYMMPEMDGLTYVEEFRKYHPAIPVVMITALGDDEELKLSALNRGVTEFLSKPIHGPDFIARVKSLIRIRESQILLQNRAENLRYEVDKATEAIRDRELEAIQVLGKAAEYRDTDTGNHIVRVATYCKIIAESLEMDYEFVDTIFFAAPLHDIGKIGIPDTILLKPGRLNAEEMEIMKTHTSLGAGILRRSKSKYLRAGAAIAESHHERWDGTGYPFGTKGDDIPLMGRIVSVADVFDALSSNRPYKDPWPMDKVISFIQEYAGTQFDPSVVEAFMSNKDEILTIHRAMRG